MLYPLYRLSLHFAKMKLTLITIPQKFPETITEYSDILDQHFRGTPPPALKKLHDLIMICHNDIQNKKMPPLTDLNTAMTNTGINPTLAITLLTELMTLDQESLSGSEPADYFLTTVNEKLKTNNALVRKSLKRKIVPFPDIITKCSTLSDTTFHNTLIGFATGSLTVQGRKLLYSHGGGFQRHPSEVY